MTAGMFEVSQERHLNDLKDVQGQLTLSNIMTERSEFICCTANESAQDAIARIPSIFDAIPIIDSTDAADISAPILGLLHRDRMPFRNRKTRAIDCADKLAISQALPSTRSLLVYIHRLTSHSIEFVEQDGKIVGLVSPYDLERLPVRTALFAQIIDIERLLGVLIYERFPDVAEWEKLISPELRGDLKAGLARARGSDSSGNAILTVSFAVKLDLLPHCFDRLQLKSFLIEERDEIRMLRNNVAHGAPFPNVMQLPGQLRNLMRLRALILHRISELSGNDAGPPPTFVAERSPKGLPSTNSQRSIKYRRTLF